MMDKKKKSKQKNFSKKPDKETNQQTIKNLQNHKIKKVTEE